MIQYNFKREVDSMKNLKYRCESCGKQTAHYEKRGYVNGVFQNQLLCANCTDVPKNLLKILEVKT